MLGRTVFFCCDIQTKFESAIYGWSSVIHTASKMTKFAKILNIPVIATEQNPSRLGSTSPTIGLSSLPSDLHLGTFAKTKFSMVLSETTRLLEKHNIETVVLYGIESHICVLQTAIELLAQPRKLKVFVLADGVSSCNPEEVPIALARLRQEGAIIATSESLLFQLQHDAGTPTFKPFTSGIKDVKDGTKDALKELVPIAVGSKL